MDGEIPLYTLRNKQAIAINGIGELPVGFYQRCSYDRQWVKNVWLATLDAFRTFATENHALANP